MESIFKADLTVLAWNLFPLFIPAIMGIIVLIIDRYWRDDDKDILVIIASGALVAMIVLFWRQWMAGDILPKSYLSLVIVSSVLSVFFLLASISYYQMRGVGVAGFVAYFLFAVFGVNIALATPNLIAIFIGLSITSIALIFLLKHYAGAESGVVKKIWIYLLISDIVFCLGSVFFFGAAGTFNLSSGSGLVDTVNQFHTGNYFRISFAIIATALFAKLAVVPIHWWVLDIAAVRSLPLINAIVIFYRSAVVLIALSVFAPTVNMWSSFFEVPMMVIAVLTMSFANISAIKSRDMKELIGFSSIAHIGYILALFPAVVIAGGLGVPTIIFMTVAFAVSHMGALVLLQTLSSFDADRTSFNSLEGLGRRHSSMAVLLGLFLMSMACLPPFIGFLAKFMMLRELASNGSYLLLIIVALNFVTAFYYLARASAIVFCGRGGDVQEPVREIAYPIIVVLTIAAFIAVYLGLMPSSFINWIRLSMGGV